MENNTRCTNLSLVNPNSIITYDLPARVVLAILFSFVATTTVLGNFLVISALISARFKCFAPKTKDSSNKTQYLLISMAVSDFVLGSTIMPLGIYNIVKDRRWELGSTFCTVREVCDIILSAVSFLHVACMALDRYLAVCKPLLFRTLTKKATFFMIGVCWIFPTTVVMTIVLSGWHIKGIEHVVLCSTFQKTCMFYHNKHSILLIILVFLDLPLIATFVFYFLVLREVKKYHRRKPAIYFCQKSALQVELNNRKIIGTMRFNASNLHKENRGSQVEITSKVDKNVSINRGLLRCFLSGFNKRKPGSRKRRYSESLSNPNVLSKSRDIELIDKGPLDEENSLMMKPPEFKNREMAAELTEVSRCTHQSTVRNDSINSDNYAYRQKLPIRMATDRPRSNIKAVITIGLIVVCFTVCWLPINIVVLMGIFQDYASPSLSLFALWLAYTNSMINPLIYCYQRSIRSAVLSVVCPARCSMTR